MNAKAVACYVRVSEFGPNQAKQRRDINRWLKDSRIKAKSVQWYVDKSTGDDPGQPNFEKLQADISKGEVGTVVIWRLDRLSPTMRDGLSILCDWSKRPLRIVSVTQHIDFKGGAGKAVASVVNGLAEMAYDTKREQSKAGLEAARASGRMGGRPELAADDPKVLKVKKLRKDGQLSVNEICKRVKISRSTYYRYVDL